MSRFFSDKYSNLTPYTPGEQPQDKKYLKLNTNESPFPPSPKVLKAVEEEAEKLELYSDPECEKLREKGAEIFAVNKNQIVFTNGSDEALNFAFMAFADEKRPLAFPDITYGFYPVFALLNNIPFTEIPLKDDFSINVNDYVGINKTIVIANPNAPTGLSLSLKDIEMILQSNPNNVVIIDEAYVDFGAESAIKLINDYENLLVTGTFSKSRSMAGARLGFAIGPEKLIKDLNTIRFSTNPYNINRMTSAAGFAAFEENDYYMNNCKVIAENRTFLKNELEKLDFFVLPSKANFLFAKSERINGEELYLKLKEKGVLIRHFSKERIKNFNRITIGTKEQTEKFIKSVKKIFEEEGK